MVYIESLFSKLAKKYIYIYIDIFTLISDISASFGIEILLFCTKILLFNKTVIFPLQMMQKYHLYVWKYHSQKKKITIFYSYSYMPPAPILITSKSEKASLLHFQKLQY